MTTGEMIKAARKKAGLTQKELGAMIGVSGAMIAQYETGVRIPKLDTVQRIAEPLGVPWFDFYSIPIIEHIESHRLETEKRRNEYTELFFNPDIQKISEIFRTNGFTEQFHPRPSAPTEEQDRLVAICVSLFACGKTPPDAETLISVGFNPNDAERMFSILSYMQQKFGEIIEDRKKEAKED